MNNKNYKNRLGKSKLILKSNVVQISTSIALNTYYYDLDLYQFIFKFPVGIN